MTFAPGQLHSVLWHGDGTFNVAKVLAVDDRGLHVRVYAEQFAARPTQVPEVLEVGSPYDGAAFGVGHIPVTVAQWERWEPELLGTAPLEEDDLVDLHRWQQEASDTDYLGEEQPGLLSRLLGRRGRKD